MGITRFLISVRMRFQYHLERLPFWTSKYPRVVLQKALHHPGVAFEVTNLTELNRVVEFDGEIDFLRSLLDNLHADDVFFDIGACIGVFSLHAAHKCKSVCAFEPDPGFREHLKINININGLRNISVLPYAVTNRSSKLLLYTDGIGGKSPSLKNEGFQRHVEVDGRSLDDLVTKHNIPCPTVMKIDIEGAEILALRGMKDIFLTRPPRIIFLEIHPKFLTYFGSNKDELVELLVTSGYKIRSEKPRDCQSHCVFELIK